MIKILINILIIMLLNYQYITNAQETLSTDQRILSLPPVDICITKALNSLVVTRSEYKHWQKNIKWSELLPDLELRYGRIDTAVDRFRMRNDNDGSANLDDVIEPRNQYWLFLTWELSEFAFSRKKIEASEQQIRFDHLRINVIEKVTEYYFELKHALKELKKESSKKLKWEKEAELNRARLNAIADNCIGDKSGH